MNRQRACALWLVAALLLAGCAAGPTARLHYTLKADPASRPVQQVVLLPVDVDVYEMSAGGVKEEVPEWSRAAATNVRTALLMTAGGDACCMTRRFDTAALTGDERALVEEHLALFNTVVANSLTADLPGNSAWKFKNEHFDATLGDGLAFLKTKYGMDAGLVIVGEDVVSTAGRKTTAVIGAIFGVAVPLGHTVLIGGLVDFSSGDLLWMDHAVSNGTADLRDPGSCRELARVLMKDYPGLQSAAGAGSVRAGE